MSAALQAIAGRAAADGLTPLGAFHPAPEDAAPPGTGTLVLLGRWSARVIGEMAEGLGATAVFPFGGPPWAPFTAWARRSGEAWESPVGLLVHDTLAYTVDGVALGVLDVQVWARDPAAFGSRHRRACGGKVSGGSARICRARKRNHEMSILRASGR